MIEGSKVVEGSKAHSKGCRVRKHTTSRRSRALRRTKKDVRLGNALSKIVEGSKTHLRGRVRKHTTHEVRTRRHT